MVKDRVRQREHKPRTIGKVFICVDCGFMSIDCPYCNEQIYIHPEAIKQYMAKRRLHGFDKE